MALSTADSWAERQRQFGAALRDPSVAVPKGLVDRDGRACRKRFSVYRNNVVVGLVEALRAAFPAVARIVGEDFFRAAARAYVLMEPPASPILLDYGAGFPGFLAGFEPAAALPYLPDVARIERAWVEAYHAPEACAGSAAVLAEVPRERVGQIRFSLHPSLRMVRSSFPALTLWRLNVADGVPRPVDLAAGSEAALIVRPVADVEVRAMPPGGAEFLSALGDGAPLLDATECAHRACPNFDLEAHLTVLIGAGIFTDYHVAARTPPAPVLWEKAYTYDGMA